MHILFDLTNGRALARHESYMALAALAYIQFANLDTVHVRCGENKAYSILSKEQVASVLIQCGIKPGTAYNENVKAMRAAIEDAPWLQLPFTLEQLTEQAHAIAAKDDQPYAFDPNSTKPERLTAWHSPPQRNVKREDCSQRVHFAAGPAAAGAKMAPPPPAKVGPSKRPQAPAGPAAPTAAPKPPRAPSGPATRPKAGTSTGKVWDIADALAPEHEGDDKALRKAVVSACEKEGINASTASVQFGKWKAASK